MTELQEAGSALAGQPVYAFSFSQYHVNPDTPLPGSLPELCPFLFIATGLSHPSGGPALLVRGALTRIRVGLGLGPHGVNIPAIREGVIQADGKEHDIGQIIPSRHVKL